MSLHVLAPPAAEPVTVAEVKARLRLASSDDDGTISKNITAAREYAEKVTRRSLVPKAYKLVLDGFPPCFQPIRLPAPPLVSVQSITYLDANLDRQTWDASLYFVAANQSPALIIPKPGNRHPPTAWVPGCVEISYTAGYGEPEACPEHILEGVRQLAVHIYEHPEAVTSEGLKEAPLALMSFFSANKIYVF